jgi:signal transduction histidine kinase
MSNPDFERSITAISQVEVIPTVLRLVKKTTGLRFACVAHVTPEQWIAYAVDDSAGLGIQPGDERPVAKTLCHEVRLRRHSLVYGEGMTELVQAGYAPELKFELGNLHSHISIPIINTDGQWIGTLCALDPLPVAIDEISTLQTMELFAQLIAAHLDMQGKLNQSESALDASVATGRLREEFVAVLGHDLRTPLSAVRLSAELLQAQVTDGRSTTLVGAIRRSALRMAALIDDVLDFARCQLGSQFTVKRERVDDLFMALEPVIAEARSAYPMARIVFLHTVAQPLLCDFGRISQLVSNLLSNAVSHGKLNSPIVVNGFLDDGHLVLSFANEGDPIPAQLMKLLFKPFSRAESVNKSEGLGLGLYICSQIVQSHQGTIEVCSDEQQTIFTVKLPVHSLDQLTQ